MDSRSPWQEPLERAVRDPQPALGAFCGRCQYTLVYRKEADPLLYHAECLVSLAERSGKDEQAVEGGPPGER